MKEKGIYFMMTGIILFAVGIYCILCMDIAAGPALLFLGACMLCLPAGGSVISWHELFLTYPAGQYRPFPHESLFLARLFLSMSFLARNYGILSLENFRNDLKQDHSLLYNGKQMLVEGYDPDYVRESIGSIVQLTQEQIKLKMRTLRQIGSQSFFVGLFGALAGGISYGYLGLQGREIPDEGIVILLALTACFIMTGALFSLLLPANLKTGMYRLQRIQHQILSGLLAVQNGDSCNSVLQMQTTFLTAEELEILAQCPLLEEAKAMGPAGNYEVAESQIRQYLKNTLNA